MANGISKNPLTDISKVYLNQIAEGSLKSLEKASVLAMSDKPEDQDKAREIKTRFDYQSLMKQKKAKKGKVMEARSNWRHDLREIITTEKDSEEPQIKEKKIKNKIEINPSFKEAVEKLGGKLLTVEEVSEDPKKAEQMRKKEKMLKKRMLMMKLEQSIRMLVVMLLQDMNQKVIWLRQNMREVHQTMVRCQLEIKEQ